MISTYETKDYDDILELIKACGLPEASAHELEGFGLVWREGDKAVGFVWALLNQGGAVYIDHFCVHPDYRDKNKGPVGRSKIAVELMITMMGVLASQGKTRIQGVLHRTDYGRSLERTYNKVGMKFVEPHAFVYGNIKEILNNLLELKNG